MMSVRPIATMTSSMGVITRLPSTWVKSLSPSYSSVVLRKRLASRTMMLLASSSSAESVTSPLTRLPAV